MGDDQGNIVRLTDTVGRIEDVACALKVLLPVCEMDLNTIEEGLAVQNTIAHALRKIITILNGMMKELSENVEGVTYKPVEV